MPHSVDRDSASTSTGTSDGYTAATTPSSFADYTLPPGQTPQLSVSSPPMESDRLSPALAGFSFTDHSEPASPTRQTHEPLQPVRERKESMRPIDWDSPGSPREVDPDKASQRASNARRKTEFWEDSFSYKDDWETHQRDKAVRDSPIVAELRTNVIVSGMHPV